MSELISGKEALIALANEQEVETKRKDEITWSSIGFFAVNVFKDENWEFRLKTRTITINGIEVPASSNVYSGGLIWILSGTDTREYTSLELDENDEFPAYFWKSEEEIKQVVAALRKIFVINNQ